MEARVNRGEKLVPLFPELNQLLLELLRSLQPADWQRKTVAKLWTIKDVVAHLLDGNIRVLSMLRDGYSGESPVISSRSELIDYLNSLNADWVKAMKRVSPAMLILLHEVTAPLFEEYYAELDPFAPAVFAVDWAGEQQSTNGTHLAREYTEKWLHQQQIRYALGDDTLMNPRYYHPFLNVFMLALPYTYRDVDAPPGTIVRVTIPGLAEGSWDITKQLHQWKLTPPSRQEPVSEVCIEAVAAWQLFSKSKNAEVLAQHIRVTGNQHLGAVALNMVSVMA